VSTAKRKSREDVKGKDLVENATKENVGRSKPARDKKGEVKRNVPQTEEAGKKGGK